MCCNRFAIGRYRTRHELYRRAKNIIIEKFKVFSKTIEERDKLYERENA